MSLNIKHPEADKLARALAGKMGDSITHVVIEALREKLEKEQGRHASSLKEELMDISRRCSGLKDRDRRSVDEILGYNEYGLPGDLHGH